MANEANNKAYEEAESEPAWKNARPHRHDAKQQRADHRQWPNDEQWNEKVR